MPADVTLTATQQALAAMADALVQAARNNLAAAGHNNTGRLANSITATPQTTADGVMSIDIQALDYYDYVNKGVRGTRGGSGQYVFKSSLPGAQMVNAIKSWMVQNNITPVKKATVHSMANSSGNALAAAFAISRSVLQKGIPPTGFLDNAVNAVTQQYSDAIAQAAKTDIINAIK